MKVGDIVRVEVNIYGSIAFTEFELEEFHGCFGFFKDETARKGSMFTPLCALLEPISGTDVYISNYGSIFKEHRQTYEVINRSSVPNWKKPQDDYACFI